MQRQALANKNILIAGASGFIGHAIASSLSTVDCSLTRTSRNVSCLLPLNEVAQLNDVEIDYTDANAWSDLIEGIDIVFYLAAQTSSTDANKNPQQDFLHNVLPLLNLLEAIKERKYQPTIVFASTATIVGLSEDLPISEAVCANPVTVYDIHKLCCENYLSYYAASGLIQSCSLRLANVYGPGVNSASADRGILNMMIRRAIDNEALSIFGEGRQIRDYIYISDVVSAFLAAAIKIDNVNGRYFNIGSGSGHSFNEAFGEIANCAASQLPHDVRIEHIEAPEDLAAIESRNYIADTREFSQATQWSADVELRDGIRKTLQGFLQ